MKFDIIIFDDKFVGFVDLDDKIFGFDFCLDILYCCVCY